MKFEFDVLTSSLIFGVAFNGLIIGFYSLFSLSIPGMTQFFNIDYFFLIGGFILLSAFSFFQVSYDEKNNVTQCSSFTASTIIGLCLFPSVVVLFFLYILPLLFGHSSAFPTGNFICFLLPLILSILGILFSILSFNTVKHCVKPQINRSYKLKKRIMQISIIVFIIGCIMTGVTLSFGMIDETEIHYEIKLETKNPTTFLIPLPINTQNENYSAFVKNLELVSGVATWNITETSHGVALQVETNTSCHLFANKFPLLMNRRQMNTLFKIASLSMKNDGEHDEYSYIVNVFSSVNNTTVNVVYLLGSNLGSWIEHNINYTFSTEGWKQIEVRKQWTTI